MLDDELVSTFNLLIPHLASPLPLLPLKNKMKTTKKRIKKKEIFSQIYIIKLM
jgi:hypothetical protein